MVARTLGVGEVVGSIPSSSTNFAGCSPVVGRMLREHEVAGSIPVTPTNFFVHFR